MSQRIAPGLFMQIYEWQIFGVDIRQYIMAYRYGQNYESSVHNIKGIIKTSKVHTIYQSCTKYIKLGNLISKCAHKISTTVTRSSNMKGSGSNQSEDCRHVTSKNGSRAMFSFSVVWQRFPSSFIGLTVFLLSS